MQSSELMQAKANDGGSLWERPLWQVVALDWEKALYLTIILLAIVSRFWDLGARALHHDESLHATYSYYLFTGRGYTHDPLLHGTFIYHLNALVYLLFGAGDANSRLAPAFLSVLTVGLPYFLRRELGRLGALAASALLLISPSFMYFGRFIREDAHVAFFTLAMVVCVFRYLEARCPRYLYLFAALFALGFLTKETTYILAASLGSFLLLAAGGDLWQLFRRAPCFSPAGDVLVVLGTLTATQLGGLAILYRRLQGLPIPAYATPDDYTTLAAAFAALVSLAVVIGLRWNPRVWLIAAATFFAIFTVFFTTLFSNPAGFFSGSIGGLVYWLAQQEVRRGAQPWYYYLLLLPLYEYLVLCFAVPGLLHCLRRRSLFTLFLVHWALTGLVIYSWAGEKMPWLVLHVALPLLLIAAAFLGHLLTLAPWRERARERVLLVGAAVVGLVLVGAILSLPRPGSAGTPLRAQQLWAQWGLLTLLLAVLAYGGLRAAERLGARGSAITLAVGSLVVLVPLTLHTATQVAFTNGDVAVEMLVYTQTTPDVPKVMREIERIAFRTGAGRDLKVAYDSDVTWPFEWYLRDYRGRNFYGTGTPATDAPVVLVGLEGNNDARIRPLLGNKYVGQRYRLRWWFPEDYQSADAWLRAILPEDKRANVPAAGGNVSFLDIVRASLQPEARGRLWRYFLFRETLNPLGSTDFMLYVRKDLVGGGWVPASVAPTVETAEDPFAPKVRTLAAARVLGGPSVEAGQLRDPKNVAVGPDGSVYVLDTGANRVLRFAADGRLQEMWGGAGAGPGQFKEPWGIAVDAQGFVYVADSWNHRIQKFAPGGRFLLQWGDPQGQPGSAPGQFYGPRGLAFDREGNVLVVDTGNKRVQKFSPEGAFLAQYGGPGAAEGLLNEPVGIAVDGQGNVYVTDTWNHRIQKFDPQFSFLAQWEVPVWLSESVVNKPFLAVDAEGNVVASDPEGHRVFRLNDKGEVQAVWGGFGTDNASLNLPLGVAMDGLGNVYVADSGNRRVVVYAPVR